MTLEQITFAVTVWLFITWILYTKITWKKIRESYSMWFTREYWTDYNIVEASAWGAKALIIIPGLIFGIQIWWLYFLTMFTSIMLVWASEKKLLPTLVAFNTMWIWLSLMVIAQNVI